ncbi:MAG: DUF4184 family protein [Candidatus Hodarchaeales archaeon]
MPFTPFHIGIALILFAVFPFMDPTALLIGSIAPDIEGFLAIFIFPDLDLPLHGPLHSFLGAVTLGLIIAPISHIINYYFVKRLNLENKYQLSRKFTFISSQTGTFSHILLDAPLYPEMNLFYPLKGNVLFQIVPYSFPYLICALGFITGLTIIITRYSRQNRND